jgi:hypothetical protein
MRGGKSLFIIAFSLLAALSVAPHSAFAALSLDGHANGGDDGAPFSGAGVTLTTTDANDVVVFEIFNENDGSNIPTTVSSVSDSAGLTWHLRTATTSPAMQQYADEGVNATDMEIWWAHAPAQLSSDTIVPTLSGTTDCISYVAFGVNGANTATPWDTNGSLPTIASSASGVSTPSVSGISTAEANTMILGFMGTGSYGSDDDAAPFVDGSGYTSIDSSLFGACAFAASTFAEYELVSSAQSNIPAELGAPLTSGDGWFMIGDAIQAASPPATTGRVIRLVGGLRIVGGVRLGGTSPVSPGY